MRPKYITDESERFATFMRKRNELLRELSEISILHGAETCLILYNPWLGGFEAWPNHVEADRVAERFKTAIERKKKEAEANKKDGGSSSSTPP